MAAAFYRSVATVRDDPVPIVLLHGELFHRDITGSRLVVLPALGHVPHEEGPAATVAIVRDFLAAD